MADIDFDELDKAVNRLMDQRKGVSTTPSADTSTDTSRQTQSLAAPMTNQSTTPEPISQPAPPKDNPPAQNRPQSTQRPSQRSSASSPAIKRRTGRFMDIVPPSQSASKTSQMAPSGRVSRSGASLAPVTPSYQAPSQDQPDDATDVTAPSPDMTPPTAADSIADRIAATLAGHADETPTDKPEESIASRASLKLEPIDTPEQSQAADREPDAPLQSPFLSNTNVQKRPLGAPSQPAAEPKEDFITGRASDDEITPEMDEAVLAVEAREVSEYEEPSTDEAVARRHETSPSEPSATQDKDNTTQDDDEEELLLPATASPAPEPVKTPASETRPPRPTQQGDIPKQYNVTSSEEDEPSSIYDPAHYQSALEHPAKKRSGWWIVLWIVILLAVGAGAGAAAYIYLLR